MPDSIDGRLSDLERLIHRDPARRGLIGTESGRAPLCQGHFAEAARHLANHGRSVAIISGFFIPGATPPAAETDGPPGAAILSAALRHSGIAAQIVTDAHCESAMRVAAREMGLPESTVVTIPSSSDAQKEWFHNFLEAPQDGYRLTHLIALERVGPSHDLDSIQRHLISSEPNWQQRLAEFADSVPEHARNRCHNMRGECIDAHTAPLHRLFEMAHCKTGIRTIGIGDGGNEIGMGSIMWHELTQRLSGPAAARVPCRIATDWTIVCGVSNWGGQALAAAVLMLKGMANVARNWTALQQLAALERIVMEGPAVDGITRQQTPTVDGLPFLTYIQPWEGMRRLMGLES